MIENEASKLLLRITYAGSRSRPPVQLISGIVRLRMRPLLPVCLSNDLAVEYVWALQRLSIRAFEIATLLAVSAFGLEAKNRGSVFRIPGPNFMLSVRSAPHLRN